LKNDGVRQWEGLIIPYMKWKIKFMFESTSQDIHVASASMKKAYD